MGHLSPVIRLRLYIAKILSDDIIALFFHDILAFRGQRASCAAQPKCQHRPGTLASWNITFWRFNVHAFVPLGHVRLQVSSGATVCASQQLHSANIRLPCSPTLLRPSASQSATILPILHLSVASALSNSSPIPAAEATEAALQLLHVILTRRQQRRNEPKHLKNYPTETWRVYRWDFANIATNTMILSKTSYRGYNIDISLRP